MVNTTDFYLMKFQFEAVDAETGEMKKQKREFLAECTSYTEAEKLAYSVMEDSGWMKHDYSKPEIVRIKVNDIRLNDCVTIEEDVFGGYFELYLEDDSSYYYQVNVSDPYEDEKGMKYTKISLFIPAGSTGEAESYALKLYPNAFVSAAKMVSFRSAFMTGGTVDKIKRQYESM